MAGLAVDDADKVIFAVGIDRESLFLIGESAMAEMEPVPRVAGSKYELMPELAVASEDLDAIGGAVADVIPKSDSDVCNAA